VQGTRSDKYRAYFSDERHSNRGNPPRPFGLLGKLGHTSLSPSNLEPPSSWDSALYGAIFPCNAVHPSSVNRP
jgi:hypothetical protein